MDDAKVLRLLQPETLGIFDLAALLERLGNLRQQDEASAASLADLPIHRFFCESNVGLKFVAVADQRYETRKDEAEKETTAVALERTLAELKTRGWLFCPSSDPLKDEEFKTFIFTLHKELAKFRSAKTKRKECPFTQRLQAIQADVFDTARRNFKTLYMERVQNFCEGSLLFIEKPDDRVLDLQQLGAAFALADLRNSELFTLEELDSEHRATAEAAIKNVIGRCEKYVLAFQFAICYKYPKVALLFEAPPEAGFASLDEAASGLVVSEFVALAGSSCVEEAARLVEWVTGEIRRCQKERFKTSGQGVLSLIDEQLAGEAKIPEMTEDKIDHLVKQVPTSCRDFLSKWFGMSNGLSFPPTDGSPASFSLVLALSAKIRATLFSVPELVGCKEAMEFMETERVEDMREVIEKAFRLWNGAAAKMQQIICEDMEKLANKLMKAVERIEFAKEEKMLSHMRKAATSLADQQRELEKARAKAEKAFQATEQNFEKDAGDVAEFVGQTIGASLAAIAAFTAISLYRSTGLGKTTSAQAKASMKKKLGTIDANPRAIKAERHFGLATMEEIRKTMKCPLPPLPPPQEKVLPTTELPPAPESKASAESAQASGLAATDGATHVEPTVAGASALATSVDTDLVLVSTLLPVDVDPALEDTQPAEITCALPQTTDGCLLGECVSMAATRVNKSTRMFFPPAFLWQATAINKSAPMFPFALPAPNVFSFHKQTGKQTNKQTNKQTHGLWS